MPSEHPLPNRNANDNATLNDEAAHWLIRLGAEDLTAEERARFDAWLRADPAHTAAFHRASRTWAELAHVSEASVRPRPNVGRYAWRALAAALALVFALGAWHVADPITAFTADYRSGFGEIREAKLADGSRVYLNTDSAIAVEYGEEVRRVRLLKGEAVFDVAPMSETEARPFVVAALGGTSRALGTRFSVRIDDQHVRVAVEEHRVAVASPAAHGGGGKMQLGEGDSVVYTSDGALGEVVAVDPGRVSSWRRGRLVFDRQRLSDVVDELNRYRAGRIMVTDAELASRRVSGVFHLDDLSGAVDVIADELGARTVAVPPLVTVIF